ncbi:MAG: GIY-YIG nuclease family protein [Verrucomicrobiia bacterium]
MAWVYMLRGSSGRYYIGSTTDLNRRLEQHRQGHTYSTRRLGQPLALAASLELDSLPEARALEREMKRKKNPGLALFLLEKRRTQPGG